MPPRKFLFPLRKGVEEDEEEEQTKTQLCVEGLRIHWRFVVLLLWPVFAALVFIAGTGQDIRCLYIIIIMAGYWVSEALPLGVTSFFPIAFFPLLGVLDTASAARTYLNNTTIMFLCSLMIAFAIEASNLHRRLALKMMLCIGTTHLRLTFGFMLITTFVSMWFVSTATTAMMAPIVLAVLTELEENDLAQVYLPPQDDSEKDKPLYPSRTTVCYFLIIAYGATIGGTGTLIGTGTNLAYKGIFEERFDKAPQVDFAHWIACKVPLVLLMAILSWGSLAWQYLGLWRNTGMDESVRRQKIEDPEAAVKSAEVAKNIMQARYEELGSFSWAEAWVTILFLGGIVLWIKTDPSWIKGWAPLISDKKIRDATPALVVVILLFAIPIVPSVCYCLSSDPKMRPDKQAKGILNWPIVNGKMKWGLMFLVGSGYAISTGSKESGMSTMLANQLTSLQVLPPWVVLFLVCVLCSFVTELMSSVAVANIFLPVIAEVAVAIKVNPVYLMMPAAICCSFSFMLPVGTPANALSAAYVNIRTPDMAASGILTKLFTLAVVVLLFPTYGNVIYRDLTDFPDWAKPNTTK